MKRTLFLISVLAGIAGASPAFSRDSLGMRLLGQTLLGPARQVVVQGDYAYVGVSCGLLILDVSDPVRPVEMGRAYIATRIEDIFVQSGYAYVVDALYGLTVVDVRDVRNPRVVGGVRCGFNMFGIWVKDTLAYMVGSGGMQDSSDFFVINVKDPTAPFVVAGYDTCWGHKIQVVDTFAYVTAAGWNVSVEIYNISDPFNVRQIGQTSGIGNTEDIVVRDTLAFVASPDSGLCVVNIKDPLAPQKVVCFNPSGPPYAGPYRISVLGNYVYLCDDKVVYEGYPYRTLSYFWVIDISNPASPIELSYYVTRGSGGGVFTKDSLVYFADGGKGLRVMDVSNPALPREITHYPTGDACWELVKQGNYLYVAHGMDGLRVLDVSNPAQPVELGHLEMPWRTLDIMLKDSLLYAAEGDSGLVVVDIRNPVQPLVIGRWVPSQAEVILCVYVQDTLAYLGGEVRAPLWILNVADLHNPYLLGSGWNTISSCYDIFVQGSRAYLAGIFDQSGRNFVLANVSDPRNPTERGFETGACTYDLELVDTLAYLVSGQGLYIDKVDSGWWPTMLGGYGGFDWQAYGLHCISIDKLWTGWRVHIGNDLMGRILLLDARDPQRVLPLRYYDTGWTVQDVWGEDGKPWAYGGAYLGNLLVFYVDSAVGVSGKEDLALRIAPLKLEVHPNPVRGSCTIRLSLSLEGKVRLSIYDVTGRVVRSFAPFASRLTPYEVYWDGRDEKGKEVRSGVYLLRAESGGRAITKKLVVVR